MWTIERRIEQPHTRAFVVPETVDALGKKMIGIVGERRMTKMHRYLGKQAGTPDIYNGLRLWHGGFDTATRQRPRESVGISLFSQSRFYEGVSFSINRMDETEEQVAQRYNHPEDQFLGQRRDITLVELAGWSGEPRRDDQIRIEYWNSNGVGQETILTFDDVNPVQELFWDIKNDKIRHVHMGDDFCTDHEQHYEDPRHIYKYGVCELRPATMAENLHLLAKLADEAAKNATEG